jgi:predicted PurR-regulated permease PerM
VPNSLPPIPPKRLLTAEHADLVRAALIVLAVLIALQALWAARILALTAFIGILFGLGATPAVDTLQRWGIRRAVGSPLIILGTAVALLGLGAWIGPTLVEQSTELRTRFPEAIAKAEVWLYEHQPRLLDALAGESPPPPVVAPVAAPSAKGTKAPPPAPPAAPPPQGRIVRALYDQASTLKSFAFGVLTSTLALFAGFVLVLFLAVYIAAEPGVYRRGLLLLVSPTARKRLGPVLTAIATKLRRWLRTQAIAMLVVGIVTTIMLSLLGVRAAIPLGVIAGMFEFIPNIGPTLSAIPAVAMGFVESPEKALVVAIAYWALQFVENNVLIPYLMQDQLDLPPALTMMVQFAMAYIFGLIGLFVATPLLAAVFVAVHMLHVVPDEPDAPDVPTTPA